MYQEISEHGQLNVEISNLHATDEEIAKLKEAITRGIGFENSPPVVTFEGMDQRGRRYNVRFALRGPTHFDLETAGKWLHSVGLVGWSIDAQAGPRQ